MAAVLVLLAKPFIQATHRLYTLHQQHAQKRIPLFADRTQSPSITRTALAWDQTQIAGHLLATLEACYISHRDYVGQGRDGSDPGLRHQQARSRVLVRRTLDGPVSYTHLTLPTIYSV